MDAGVVDPTNLLADLARRQIVHAARREGVYHWNAGEERLQDVMPLKTKRWNDPKEPDDGLRILICRYPPRGVSKEQETWDVWYPQLGPSKALHGAVYTQEASKIPWPHYRRRYLAEQKGNQELIESLAERVRTGETITLLCSSACVRESRCHRSILREMIELVR